METVGFWVKKLKASLPVKEKLSGK